MRSRFLALLLMLGLGANGWGQDDRPFAEALAAHEAGEAHPPDSEILGESYYGHSPDALEMLYHNRAMDTTCLLAGLEDRYYAQFDYLYWRASRQRENGVLIKSAIPSTEPITNLPAVIINSFSTGTPNPDYEMGFRTFVGRRLNEYWSVELGGFWVHDYDYPAFFLRQQDPSSGDVIQVYLDPLSDPTLDPRFIPGADQRELSAAALIYEIETHGVDLNSRVLMHEGPRFRVDGILGLRHFHYDEKFGSRLTFPNGAVVDEKFQTENVFFGPQIGSEAWYRLARFVSVRGLAKFAFTSNFQEINVHGPAPGNGVLTGAGNLQGFDRTRYASVIELGMGLVAHLTPYMQVSAGYDGVWLSNAFRAMDQLDLAGINDRQTFLNPRSTSVWVHGINLSLRINY